MTAKRQYKPWTSKEIEFVRKNYRHATAAEIAARMGRSAAAVRKRASVLGVAEKRSKPLKPKAPKLHISPGDRVRVTFDAQHQPRRMIRTGRVLALYDRFVLVQFAGWRECVNIGTVISGDSRIERLEGRRTA